MSTLSRIREFIRCVVRISVDVLTFFCLSLRSSAALAAENLFLRKQLALYVECRKKPRRATDSVRSHSPNSPDSSNGAMSLRSSNPTRWSVGITKDSDCFGSGNLDQGAGREFQ